jgi:uncharacterized protein YyaL (SSP411 family)
MEEESFEHEGIARYLNENYVAIKVDREERPDVDAVYMSAVQRLTGRGGWPMTVWLTPDRKPFYGGTYFPPGDGDRGAQFGFLTLLRKLSDAYKTDSQHVAEVSGELVSAIRGDLSARPGNGVMPDLAVLDAGARLYRGRFDKTEGGLEGAPKFPSSLPIRFLLRQYRRTGDDMALRMAKLTLEKMATGGIYDHVGGGFHRYSTDERWLVPHFEKMLYDNALIAVAYLEGYQATGNEGFARLVREILRYVERDMTSAQGAFYSGTDADSPGPDGRRQEGRFFTWTPQEIEAVLGARDSRILEAYYGVTTGGNFEGRTILHVERPLTDVANQLGVSETLLSKSLEDSREKLYEARSRRPSPGRDEKVLAAWNGLMIGAYARAALALGEPEYADRAERAATFVLTQMRKDGHLLRSFKDGRADHQGYLEDHAFLVSGLLDLYEATSRARWLEEAIALDVILEEEFEDTTAGGYFMTSNQNEELLVREKPGYDGAEPSGNSVQALNLLRLHELTTNDRYRQRAERTIRAFAATLSESPAALSEMLLAVDFHEDLPKEIVIVTPTSLKEAEPFLARLRTTFLPNHVLVVAVQGADLAAQARRVPLLRGKVARNGQATAYVCEKGACRLPATDPSVLAQQLHRNEAHPTAAQ